MVVFINQSLCLRRLYTAKPLRYVFALDRWWTILHSYNAFSFDFLFTWASPWTKTSGFDSRNVINSGFTRIRGAKFLLSFHHVKVNSRHLSFSRSLLGVLVLWSGGSWTVPLFSIEQSRFFSLSSLSIKDIAIAYLLHLSPIILLSFSSSLSTFSARLSNNQFCLFHCGRIMPGRLYFIWMVEPVRMSIRWYWLP